MPRTPECLQIYRTITAREVVRKTELITALTPGAPLMTVVVGTANKKFMCCHLTGFEYQTQKNSIIMNWNLYFANYQK